METVEQLKSMTHEDLVRKIQELQEDLEVKNKECLFYRDLYQIADNLNVKIKEKLTEILINYTL